MIEVQKADPMMVMDKNYPAARYEAIKQKIRYDHKISEFKEEERKREAERK